MAILISQATSNSSNILSLGSNEANNTFFGTNLADHVNYWGTGNFTMPDVSTGDTIDISLPSLLTNEAKAAATAALNGNTVTFAVDGHTYALGGIADGDSIGINFLNSFYGAPQMTITRTGDSFFVSNTFFSVGSTLLVNGTTGVAVFDSTAPTASVTAATIQPSGNAVVQSTEGGTAYLVKDSVTFTDAMPFFAAGDNNFNGATVSTANTDTNVAATGLVDGTYKVYTVDGSGNLSSASTNSVIVDGTAPVFQSAATSSDGTKVILTYDGALSATTAAAGTFDVQVGGSGNTVTGVTVNGSTVELTLTSAVTNGQAVTVAYTDPTAGDDANAIQDAAGNDAVTLAAQTVTNNVADITAPTVTDGPSVASGTTISLTLDESGSAGLYTSTPTLVGTAATMVATTPNTITVSDQGSLAETTLVVSDASSNTRNSVKVFLGTSADDAISSSVKSDIMFGFSGADTFTLTAANSAPFMSLNTVTGANQIGDYTTNLANEKVVFGGTASLWSTAITGWTFTNGIATFGSEKTVSDFYQAMAGAAGEVVAFVKSGNTYLFGEGATNSDNDNIYVVLVGVAATSLSTSTQATDVVLIG